MRNSIKLCRSHQQRASTGRALRAISSKTRSQQITHKAAGDSLLPESLPPGPPPRNLLLAQQQLFNKIRDIIQYFHNTANNSLRSYHSHRVAKRQAKFYKDDAKQFFGMEKVKMRLQKLVEQSKELHIEKHLNDKQM